MHRPCCCRRRPARRPGCRPPPALTGSSTPYRRRPLPPSSTLITWRHSCRSRSTHARDRSRDGRRRRGENVDGLYSPTRLTKIAKIVIILTTMLHVIWEKGRIAAAPHLIHARFLGPIRVHNPKRHLDRFIGFCRAHDCNRQTDRQTAR